MPLILKLHVILILVSMILSLKPDRSSRKHRKATFCVLSQSIGQQSRTAGNLCGFGGYLIRYMPVLLRGVEAFYPVKHVWLQIRKRRREWVVLKGRHPDIILTLQPLYSQSAQTITAAERKNEVLWLPSGKCMKARCGDVIQAAVHIHSVL